ncbi:MAG: hypothetical protein SF052_08890 [Bacteroidia bacterium]|nr:hypothetical protein [Bacteroidia bacterium]
MKKTISAAGIFPVAMDEKVVNTYRPVTGDLAVFEVLELGKHTRIQADDRTHRYIYPGNQIMATFGARYASAQFEGYIPETPCDTYHILGQGGVIGRVASAHSIFEPIGPTSLKLIGYCLDEKGTIINTRYYRREPYKFTLANESRTFRTILSVGASMDSGKTTSAAFLAGGLVKAGFSVAFIKLTGTIYSKDVDFVKDKGACLSLDFSYFGYPTTYLVSLEELLKLYQSLLAKASEIQPDFVIIEIADGLLQQETAALLNSEIFKQSIDHVMYSCPDSLGVLGGLSILDSYGIRPFALSGLFTASPLMIEETRKMVSLPVLRLSDLDDPAVVRFFADAAPAVKTLNLQRVSQNFPLSA